MAERWGRWTALALVALSAWPSALWASGAGYLSDDYVVARNLQRAGLLRGLWDLATVAPARPGAAPYYLAVYEGIGSHSAIQALVLAALNALVALAVWQAMRAVVRERTATVAALVFAAAPNRGATRMWFQVGPYLVAVGLVALVVVLLWRADRPLLAATLAVLAVLTYEGTAGVAVAAFGGWAVGDPRARRWPAFSALTAIAAAALAAWASSPKLDVDGPGPFEHAGTIPSGLLGSGLWGHDAAGAVGLAALVAGLGVLVASYLPSFRRPGPLRREVLIGTALTALAVGPFLVGGAPFAVRGIFDRNNLVPGLGVCLILGAVLGTLAGRRLGVAVVAVVLGGMSVANLGDLADYRAAVDDGEALRAAVLEDVDPTAGTVVVVPPLDESRGVEAFILDGDLTAALELTAGEAWASVVMPERPETCRRIVAQAIGAGAIVHVYDRLDRTVRPAGGVEVCVRPS